MNYINLNDLTLDDWKRANEGTRRELDITVWHGESKSLFYVVSGSTTNETDWKVLRTFDNREKAEQFLLSYYRKRYRAKQERAGA